MKKYFTKLVFGLAVLFTALSIIPAFPSIVQTPVTVEAATIEPRADVIYWRFRTLEDGTIQKRRWNATRGYWVDPYWINVT